MPIKSTKQLKTASKAPSLAFKKKMTMDAIKDKMETNGMIEGNVGNDANNQRLGEAKKIVIKESKIAPTIAPVVGLAKAFSLKK